MGETVCERRDGSNWADSGTGTRYRTTGWWTVGTETEDGKDRELAVGNEKPHGFPFPYRTVPVPTTFARPDAYRA